MPRLKSGEFDPIEKQAQEALVTQLCVAREDQGVLQAHLVAAAGVDKSRWQLIKRHKQRLNLATLARMANALGLEPRLVPKGTVDVKPLVVAHRLPAPWNEDPTPAEPVSRSVIGAAAQRDVMGDIDLFRREAGLTMQDLSYKTRLQRDTYSKAYTLKNRVMLDSLARWCSVLGLRIRVVTQEESEWLDQIREN